MKSVDDSVTVWPEEEALTFIELDDCRGVGIRARHAFAADSVIHHFSGVICDQISQHSLQIGQGQHMSETRFIGYLSHSCDPNAALDMTSLKLIARRDIATEEIVTIDYAATEDWLHRQFACACDAVVCRGWITGRKELPNKEGQAWLCEHAETLRNGL
jgi:hypothetical protein